MADWCGCAQLTSTHLQQLLSTSPPPQETLRSLLRIKGAAEAARLTSVFNHSPAATTTSSTSQPAVRATTPSAPSAALSAAGSTPSRTAAIHDVIEAHLRGITSGPHGKFTNAVDNVARFITADHFEVRAKYIAEGGHAKFKDMLAAEPGRFDLIGQGRHPLVRLRTAYINAPATAPVDEPAASETQRSLHQSKGAAAADLLTAVFNHSPGATTTSSTPSPPPVSMLLPAASSVLSDGRSSYSQGGGSSKAALCEMELLFEGGCPWPRYRRPSPEDPMLSSDLYQVMHSQQMDPDLESILPLLPMR